MNIGEMRHRVEIQTQAPPENRNTFGEVVNTWTTLATVWAQVDAVSGNENVDQQQWRAITTYRVRIRRRNDIKTAMQVKYGTKTLDIISIEAANYPNDMVLVCQEVI